MPQASEELRAEFRAQFGQDADTCEALEYLRSQGYTEKSGWITPPIGLTVESPRATVAIDYLVDEWDYAFKENE